MEPKATQPPKLTINSFIDTEGLHINIQLRPEGKPKQLYTSIIKTLAEGKMVEYFDNLEELMDYIGNQENVKVDNQGNVLRIVGRVNTKKSKEILIAEVKIEKVAITPKMYLKELISRCEQPSPITNKELKDFLINISKMMLKDEQKQVDIQNKDKQTGSSGEQKIQPNLEQPSESSLKSELKQLRLQIKQKITQLELSATQAYDEILKQVISSNQALVKQVQLKEKVNSEVILKRIKSIEEKLEVQAKNNIIQAEKIVAQIEKKFATQEQFSAIVNKIGILGQSLQNLKESLRSTQKQQKRKKISSANKIQASSWLDTTCINSRNLELQSNKITVKKGWAYVFGNAHLSGTYIFSVEILKMSQHIGLGIIDQNYKYKNNLDKQPNWIYFDNDGDCWDGKGWKYNENGFVVGETVKVIIDFDIGTIQWVVGENIRASNKCVEIKNSRVNWVAFIYLESQGDYVQVFEL